MTNENRKKRLSALFKIDPIAGMDHRHLLNNNGRAPWLDEGSRNERRRRKRVVAQMMLQYKRVLIRLSQSGTYPNDILLRYFAMEYTHRYGSSGIYNQPVSFNYIEPFCDIKLIEDCAPYADILKEFNSMFNATDFFEFITSSDAEGFKLSSLLELPESRVFHFTINGSIDDLAFLNSDSREFIIAGFSFVRRGNSLHWYLLGGEVHSNDDWQALNEINHNNENGEVDPLKHAFLSQTIAYKEGSGKPLAIEGHETAQRTVVAGEINITTEKYYSRCIMREYENSFTLVSDDPEIYYTLSEDAANTRRKNMTDIINRSSVMWDLVGSLFKLPFYFQSKVGIPKKLFDAAGKSVKPLRERGGKGTEGTFEKVSSLEITNEDIPAIIRVLPTFYKQETDGYWRRLKDGQTGKGPDGEDAPNRTWVKTKKKQEFDVRVPKTIYIKSTIKASKIKLEEYLKASEVGGKTPRGKDKASVVYVLRCAMMKDEIYKVGFTSGTAQERANQLSKSTGVPESFVVVDSWHHTDAAALETNIFAKLDPYRVNQSREFFKSPYSIIEKIITQEVIRSK